MAQAKNYAGKLAIRYTYATNGRGIYAIDMETGKEGEVAAFSFAGRTLAMTFAKADAWRDRFAAVPFEDKGGSHPSRYYQDIAIERVMQAIAANRSASCLRSPLARARLSSRFRLRGNYFTPGGT